MGSHNIKNPHHLTQGKHVKVSSEVIEIQNFDHPIFCFRYLNKDYHIDNCNESEKKSLLEKIVMLSQMSWNDIILTSRHGLGSEKISVNSIKTWKPTIITEDVQFLLAIRFQGKKPFVGHRNRFVFHIIYVDRDFTLYNH